MGGARGRDAADGSDSASPPSPAAPASPWTVEDDASSVTQASSLHPLPFGDEIESTLQTLSLSHLKGADHAGELREQFERWHRAFTSQAPRPRFSLESRLGEGAQGVIFGVLDRDTRRVVALKTLHAAGVDGTEISRFIHEAQITAQLEHPGIVPVHDFGALPDGTVFYTMKRIEGESLAAWMRGRAADPRQRFDLLELFLRVCETVGFAHSRGVIHRDLKPRNIMVGAYGEVLVMDWGLAKVLGAPGGGARVTSLRVEGEPRDDVHRTLEGFAVGTPAYMSPEQARGESDRVDGRSDIYSLGVILYEILCGQSPYERGDVRRTLEQVAAGRWHRLEAVPKGADVDRRLRAITHKAMAFRQEDRYPNVEALAKDLHDYLAGRAVAAHRESWAERGVRLFRRHRLPVLAGAAVAVVAVVGFAGWWTSGELRRRAAIAGLRATAAELAGHDDVASLESARRRLDVLLELAPDDAGARLAAARVDGRLRRARDGAQPGRADVCGRLAAWFLARADEAEAAGDGAGAAIQLAQARTWAAAAGLPAPVVTARVAVPGDAPAATLTPIADGDASAAAPRTAVRIEPNSAVDVPGGRWLASSDGGAVAALRLARGGAVVVDLPPPPAALPGGTAWIPGGRCWDGAGRPGVDADGSEVVVRPFAIALRETTCGEWLEFLDAPETLARCDAAARRGEARFFPRAGPHGGPLWRRGAGGFELVAASAEATRIDPLLPVGGISLDDAADYARWRAGRDGIAWRLPTRWEWQLAAQGGDGRAYPWGDRADATRCASLAAGAGDGGLIARRGGSFPADRSVQGVEDLAGSLAEFVVDAQAPWAVLMGGDFTTGEAERCATWSRRRIDRHAAEPWQGVRLAVSLP